MTHKFNIAFTLMHYRKSIFQEEYLQTFGRQRQNSIENMQKYRGEIRQNYILNQGDSYTQLKDKITEMQEKPESIKFISRKTIFSAKKTIQSIDKVKSPSNNDVSIIKKSKIPLPARENKIHAENSHKIIIDENLQRPIHNSPIKKKNRIFNKVAEANKLMKMQQKKKEILDEKRQQKRQQQRQEILDEKRQQKRQQQRQRMKEEDEGKVLKQLITQIQEPTVLVLPSQDPYTPRKGINHYYVAEVKKNYKIEKSIVREHLQNSLHFIRLLTPLKEAKNVQKPIPIQLKRSPAYSTKITVIFDLDETLVHCNQNLNTEHELELSIKMPTGRYLHFPLNVRPYARQILAELSEECEIIVFTASHESYANAVIDYLDPEKKHVQHRLYRQHCTLTSEGFYVKDLRVVNRELSRTVLIDNAAYSYAFQLENGIPIIPYYEGKQDYELKALHKYIQKLIISKDVREINTNTFHLQQYLHFQQVDPLVQALYL